MSDALVNTMRDAVIAFSLKNGSSTFATRLGNSFPPWLALMSLEAGSHLGPYEILAAIGAGGMGEVYRARDTKLGREVAIKVLPEAFASDPERLRRFEREARLLASLNHPNVAAVYGFEDSACDPALVMELVSGETLRDRVSKSPIPLKEALPIAQQIAAGLEYAHEHGIIHRDLKPANIKLSEGGTVKILDFGVVLYEMLTGNRLFEGDSVPETLARVLEGQIDLANLPEGTPWTIRRLLARCLVRNPKQRLRDIGEARIAIEEAMAGKADP